jgi:membrane protease YdiL (CAAX protease family)
LLENTSSTFKKRASNIAEALFVLTLGFGLYIYSSTSTFINSSKVTTSQTYNSYDFVFMVAFDVIVLTIIAYFLKYRQWTFKDFNLDFSVKMFGVAILLVLIRQATGYVVNSSLAALNIMSFEKPSISLPSNIVSIGLIVVVNSIYEEVLLIGYFFKRFEKFHPLFIILTSSVLRASTHTYQGLANLPMIFILGLVFGVYYIKYQKLWPVIIAHGIGNIFSFLNIHYHWIDR